MILKKNEDFRIRNGHLWVFSNEIDKVEGKAENGDLVELYDSKNKMIGTGFYNRNSLISCRILSFGKIADLNSFLNYRISEAVKLRRELYPERNSCRLVFSESDYLPGLIIDKYNDTFVLQVYSFGMQKNIDIIVKALKDQLNAVNIFSRNEDYFRTLEGLPAEDTVYLGEIQTEVIDDGRIKYKIDFEKGHKTGFYFDQGDNRTFIEKITPGKNVLDAFCNSGGFGLHAAFAGAAKVTFVDSSVSEIESAGSNFALNSLPSASNFVTADVFDYLEALREKSDERFDVVMIDPPAFAKNKKSLPQAIKGYERLNRLALSAVRDDGYLVTSSCSHHLKENDFLKLINTAAEKTGRSIQMIRFNNASLDHPRLPSMDETVYLKFAVFRVTSKENSGNL